MNPRERVFRALLRAKETTAAKQSAMIRQIYAYAVCLAAVVAMMIAVPRLVGAALDFSDPLHAKQPASIPDLSSLEGYRVSVERKVGQHQWEVWDYNHQADKGAKEYELTRQDILDSVRAESKRHIITSSVSIALALLLFVSHWLLARRPQRALS